MFVNELLICAVCANASIGLLLEYELCGWDNFETCGIIDKSSDRHRWAIVAEEFSDTSTSK